MPKVLILVIYSSNPLYDAQQHFWRQYMNSSPDISCYFITFDNVPTITLDGDTLRIPGVETYEGITLKTLDALEYFLTRDSYDFIIRTNISSIWDYPRLLTHLTTLPRTLVYSGRPGGTRGEMTYASGSGMILTPDVCAKLLNARDFALQFQIVDDVDIGFTFQHLGIPLTDGIRHDLYDDTLEIPKDLYHYRVRLLPQPENVITRTLECMNKIYQQFQF